MVTIVDPVAIVVDTTRHLHGLLCLAWVAVPRMGHAMARIGHPVACNGHAAACKGHTVACIGHAVACNEHATACIMPWIAWGMKARMGHSVA